MAKSNTADVIKDFLKTQGCPSKIEAAIILGSGLGQFTQAIHIDKEIPYQQIPYFPKTSVKGHKGSLIIGKHKSQKIIAFSGRFHLYEGHKLETSILPVQVAHALHAKKLIISNAAGSINYNFSVGDLMVIEDIIHLDTLLSPNASQIFNFNHDMAISKTQILASSIGLTLQRGTYLFAKGPSYETKAEIRAFRRMGADVVGMSTAPELVESSKLKLNALAISMITNMASGVSKQKLDHSEIKAAADIRGKDFNRLVLKLIEEL